MPIDGTKHECERMPETRRKCRDLKLRWRSDRWALGVYARRRLPDGRPAPIGKAGRKLRRESSTSSFGRSSPNNPTATERRFSAPAVKNARSSARPSARSSSLRRTYQQVREQRLEKTRKMMLITRASQWHAAKYAAAGEERKGRHESYRTLECALNRKPMDHTGMAVYETSGDENVFGLGRYAWTGEYGTAEYRDRGNAPKNRSGWHEPRHRRFYSHIWQRYRGMGLQISVL